MAYKYDKVHLSAILKWLTVVLRERYRLPKLGLKLRPDHIALTIEGATGTIQLPTIATAFLENNTDQLRTFAWNADAEGFIPVLQEDLMVIATNQPTFPI
ncbi:MAG: hypothetical protein AAGF77_13225, partial [Bacteroidota bacterium]